MALFDNIKPIKGKFDLPNLAPKLDTTTLKPMKTNIIPEDSKGGLFSKITPMQMSAGLGIFEGLASLGMIAQSVNAKPPEITRPAKVNLEAPKLEYEGEATRNLIKEGLNTAIASTVEGAKQTGQDVSRLAPGIFGKAGRLFREGAEAEGKDRQQFENTKALAIAETENKESMINTEIENQYRTRRDQILAEDALKRGMQISQGVSNIGTIGSRLMNDYLLTSMLEDQSRTENMYAAAALLNR